MRAVEARELQREDRRGCGSKKRKKKEGRQIQTGPRMGWQEKGTRRWPGERRQKSRITAVEVQRLTGAVLRC